MFCGFFKVADQSGKTLELPHEERRSLVTAMALHEKGRAALKNNQYGLALVFLLEADKEFRLVLLLQFLFLCFYQIIIRFIYGIDTNLCLKRPKKRCFVIRLF